MHRTWSEGTTQSASCNACPSRLHLQSFRFCQGKVSRCLQFPGTLRFEQRKVARNKVWHWYVRISILTLMKESNDCFINDGIKGFPETHTVGAQYNFKAGPRVCAWISPENLGADLDGVASIVALKSTIEELHLDNDKSG